MSTRPVNTESRVVKWKYKKSLNFNVGIILIPYRSRVPHEQPYSQRLILYFPLAMIFVAGGPKLIEFYDAFSNQRATMLKADGKEILSVKISLNAVSDGEPGSSGTPEGQGTAQG